MRGIRLSEPKAYLIQVGTRGPYKFGFTQGSVEERLAQLQVANPYKLRVVATRPGFVEQAVRDALEHLRIRGEWVRYTPHVVGLFMAAIEGPPRVSRKLVAKNTKKAEKAEEVDEGGDWIREGSWGLVRITGG